MIPKEQIERFFTQQCTAEEAQQVADWLKANPDIAATYLDEKDWQELPDDEPLLGEASGKIWQQINKKIRKQKLYILLKRSAVAACVAGGMYLGVFYFLRPTSVKPIFAHQANAALSSSSDTEYNASNKTKPINLKDGSVVLLSPKSFVWFDTPFAKQKRDIHLQGEARFEVAKNKQQPFTVYAAAFSTTALGTEFIVKQNNNNVSVQLLHGKVVIKNSNSHLPNWKDVYLLPGQQMIYNEGEGIAKIVSIEKKKAATVVASSNKTITQRETPDSLIFNGSPMNAVFQKLHEYYNVEIVYTRSDIQHISFTGVIVKKDSVQNILKVITQMNGLTLEQNDTIYTIQKEKND